jgi:hypothetical protein
MDRDLEVEATELAEAKIQEFRSQLGVCAQDN